MTSVRRRTTKNNKRGKLARKPRRAGEPADIWFKPTGTLTGSGALAGIARNSDKRIEREKRESKETSRAWGEKGGRPSEKPSYHQIRLDYKRCLFDCADDPVAAHKQLREEYKKNPGAENRTISDWLRNAGIPGIRKKKKK